MGRATGPLSTMTLWRRNNHAKYSAAHNEQSRKYYAADPEKGQARARKSINAKRMRAMEALGGARCNHCGYDTDLRALTIDHIHGGGQREMREVNWNIGKVYERVMALGTAMYQVLCANCNRIKQFHNKEFGRGPAYYRGLKKD